MLADLDLHLTEHRIGVIGANGSGKSTFARLLNGLVRADGGQRAGRRPGHPHARCGRSAGGWASCSRTRTPRSCTPRWPRTLAYGLENQGVPPAERTERVAEVLDRYGLAGHADHPAHLLSGGQKQLLAIAGVLVMRPARIVFDEPTTLLDLVNARRVATVIEELAQHVVVVTHDLDLLDGFDRVLVVDDGRVVEDDAPEVVGARPTGS